MRMNAGVMFTVRDYVTQIESLETIAAWKDYS